MGLFNKWKKKVEVEPYRISAPVAGKVIDIKDTNDQVFNSEALGKGVGIIASEKQGDTVVRGDILLKVDFDAIREAGYDPTVLMVVTNTAQYAQIKCNLGNKSNNDIIIEIEE